MSGMSVHSRSKGKNDYKLKANLGYEILSQNNSNKGGWNCKHFNTDNIVQLGKVTHKCTTICLRR